MSSGGKMNNLMRLLTLATLGIFVFLQINRVVSAETGVGAKPFQQAFFAAGCFWKVQYIFSKVPGVVRTQVGYSGGYTKNPSYKDVCTDLTNHAETCLVEFDPTKTSYQKLLKVFFENHDPTTMNRQGPDSGTQYRSAIFYTTPKQKEEALQYKESLEKSHRFSGPIVTEIKPASQFYPAEAYHQNYYEKHGAVCF
jgi:peptide-methionine (S)-S-oxide reductase